MTNTFIPGLPSSRGLPRRGQCWYIHMAYQVDATTQMEECLVRWENGKVNQVMYAQEATTFQLKESAIKFAKDLAATYDKGQKHEDKYRAVYFIPQLGPKFLYNDNVSYEIEANHNKI